MDAKKLLRNLCSLCAPAGFEEEATEKAAELLKEYCGEVTTDIMGNAVGVIRCGRENAVSMMLDAHIDEIGFVATGAEEGFIRIQTLGGVDARMLPASRIRFMTDPPVYGVVSVMPVHALPEGESDKPMKIDDMYVDVGLTQEEAEKLVPVGTPAVYDADIDELQNGRLTGKAFDDRACFVCILRALEILKGKKLNIDLYVLASTQEEVGSRGAVTGTFGIMPDYAIATDVTHAATPDCSNWRTVPLGSGANIARGPNMNRKLTELCIKTAEEKGIPYTVSAEPGGDSGTDTSVIQTSHEGVATALISLPLRYMHTPVEVISLDDMEACARLIAETVLAVSGGEENA